jgi:hypothetical protein
MELHYELITEEALAAPAMLKDLDADFKDVLTHKTWDIVLLLTAIYGHWFPEEDLNDVVNQFLWPILRNEAPVLPAKPSTTLRDGPRMKRFDQWFQFIRAVACCAEAYKLESTGNAKDRDIAWLHVAEAWTYVLNLFVESGISPGLNERSDLSAFAKKGADARHAENRALRQELLTWYAANKANFRSMDAAAEHAAGRIVPVKFRTVRTWIGAFNKQQSAGKA